MLYVQRCYSTHILSGYVSYTSSPTSTRQLTAAAWIFFLLWTVLMENSPQETVVCENASRWDGLACLAPTTTLRHFVHSPSFVLTLGLNFSRLSGCVYTVNASLTHWCLVFYFTNFSKPCHPMKSHRVLLGWLAGVYNFRDIKLCYFFPVLKTQCL